MDKPAELEDRLVAFAVRIVNIVEALPSSKAGNHVAGQLIRSGTAPAPNYGEAQSAESRKDFIHKMKIALKELRETLIWLKIIERKPLCEPSKMTDITKERHELIAIFGVSKLPKRTNDTSGVFVVLFSLLLTSYFANQQSTIINRRSHELVKWSLWLAIILPANRKRSQRSPRRSLTNPE